MSPLDDQLHTALHTRAADIAAPADPLAGIERRASRIRRRRAAALVAGGAALVTAVALTVPALLPGEPRATLTPATQAPTTAPPLPGFQTTPDNVLSAWPQRGTTDRAPSDAALRKDFAQAMNRATEADRVTYRSLFVGDTGKGEAFTVGQAWFLGDAQAYDVSYTTRPNDPPVFFVGRTTAADPSLLAFVVPNLAGMSDLLVVVPKPGTGQVLYSPDATGAFQPITGQDRYDGVVLIDRSTSATNDQLELLDGNGDLDHPTYKGAVAPLVCGLGDCT